MDFFSSQTFANLQTAYQDELLAAAQYRLYALRAEEDGKKRVSIDFYRMADRAMTHAALCLKMQHEGQLPTTLENLRAAAKCEFGEWTHKYYTCAQTAREEGFIELATLFDRLADISRYHNVCFCSLADALNEERLFQREEDTVWMCLGCGYVHTHTSAPKECPVCGKPQGWFEDLSANE
jgi:rubrerythrin